MKLALLTVSLILIATTTSAASAQPSPRIAAIDRYTKNIDVIVKRSSRPQLVFADTAQSEEDPKWRKFASEKALEAFREKAETYTTAYNWLDEGKIVFASFTYFSPSGDWAKYVYSYFRSDGTLAKVNVDYRTFYSNLIINQAIYFDRTGKVIKQKREVRDLVTRRLKKGKLDTGDIAYSMFSEKDYFTDTKRLPYAGLINTRSAIRR